MRKTNNMLCPIFCQNVYDRIIWRTILCCINITESIICARYSSLTFYSTIKYRFGIAFTLKYPKDLVKNVNE